MAKTQWKCCKCGAYHTWERDTATTGGCGHKICATLDLLGNASGDCKNNQGFELVFEVMGVCLWGYLLFEGGWWLDARSGEG